MKFVKFDDGNSVDYGVLKNSEITWKSDGEKTYSEYIQWLFSMDFIKVISEEEYQINTTESLEEEVSLEEACEMVNKVLDILERIESKVDKILEGNAKTSEGYISKSKEYMAKLHTRETVIPKKQAESLSYKMGDWNDFVKEFMSSLKPVTLTENQKRAKLIEEAVEETNRLLDIHKNSYPYAHVDFQINSLEGNVEAFRKSTFHPRFAYRKRVSRCNPKDVFNADIGKLIALSRLMNIEIDPKFLNAPQPTEYVAGMLITFPQEHRWNRKLVGRIDKINETTTPDTTIIIDITNEGSNCVGDKMAKGEKTEELVAPIIDDTRAVYEEDKGE